MQSSFLLKAARYARLNELKPNLKLDTVGLAYLTDFYFDARYPGDDFYTVSKEEFEKCLAIMYDTVNKLKSTDPEKM